MASPVHCFYCFECLDASFQRRDPPKLESYLALYDDFIAQNDQTEDEDVDEEDAGRLRDQEEDDPSSEGGQSHSLDTQPERARPQLPSISRLQASKSSSRSSSTSLPSTISAESSTTRSSTSTAATSLRPSYASRLSVNESYPLFVTWNTLSKSGHKSLRGCIGTFEGLPLSTGLQSYSLTSAFDDTRFSPIPASLLSSLACSLTLLADFESCLDALDWDLGTHGIRISFNYRSRRHGATYLPDVAVEQGWTKEETIESLMKKAGWDGGTSGVARRLLRGASRGADAASSKPWEDVSDFKAVRYTGLKASATYTEWQEYKSWAQQQDDAPK